MATALQRSEQLAEFQGILGYQFRQIGLLQTALTHPSIVHDHPGSAEHNQRLEFLGDAVLQLVLAQELFARFPGVAEGPLTKARAHCVNEKTLAQHGRSWRLGEFLQLNWGEEKSGGRDRTSSLADAVEAVIGAIFLDSDYPTVRQFVARQFEPLLGDIDVIPLVVNPKGDLQEHLQSESQMAPFYKLEQTSGPDHDRVFISTVHHKGVELGRGEGKSKKEAETAAALDALTRVTQAKAVATKAS